MSEAAKVQPDIDALPFWSLSWASTVRDAVTSLSLANLCFLRVWGETLAYRKNEQYLMKRVPGPMDDLATVAAVLLLASVIMGLVWICRRYLNLTTFRVIRFLSFGLLIVPLNALRTMLSAYNPYLKSPMLVLFNRYSVSLVILPLSIVAVWFLWTRQRLVVKVAVMALISLFPFCIFTFAQALWAAAQFRGQPIHDLPSAPRLANPRITPRVVWAIFDEWDYRLTFRDRPASLKMPAIDRLVSESLSARFAYSPAMYTGASLPSLLTGRRLKMADSAPSRYSATEVEGLDRISWTELPNIFSVARAAGFNTSVVGWYLPYCRMFNTVVTDCNWWPMPNQATSMGESFGPKVVGEFRSLLESDSMSLFGQSLAVKQKAAIYRDFLKHSEKLVSDPEMGVTFLHVPVPHLPNPYNRFTGKLDASNNPLKGYIDSLALLDAMVATLRRDMESSGAWDKTVVLLSSDHPFRASEGIDGKSDPRVPFLLHFPHDSTGLRYEKPVHSIVSPALLMSVLRGEITGRQQAIEWFDRHVNDLELPVGQARAAAPDLGEK